jgi:hypothetical protein
MEYRVLGAKSPSPNGEARLIFSIEKRLTGRSFIRNPDEE